MIPVYLLMNDGIVPVKQLFPKFKKVNFVNEENDAGMLPVSPLPLTE